MMLLSEKEYNKIAMEIADGKSIPANQLDMFLKDTETMKILEIENENELADKEIENLENAISEYDYLCNDGTIFRNEKDLMTCFVNENFENYEPVEKVKKAFMEYVVMHEKLFTKIFENNSDKIASEFLVKQK